MYNFICSKYWKFIPVYPITSTKNQTLLMSDIFFNIITYILTLLETNSLTLFYTKSYRKSGLLRKYLLISGFYLKIFQTHISIIMS